MQAGDDGEREFLVSLAVNNRQPSVLAVLLRQFGLPADKAV